MKKAVVIVKKFLDSNKEARVDAYAAQAAFYIIMGAIPFLMLLLILLQYTPMTKEDLLNVLAEILPGVFRSYLADTGKWNLCDQYGAAVRNSHCCFVGQRPYCHGNF